MGMLSSTWSWSPTWQVQEMSIKSRSKGQRLDGKPCRGIGVKIGKATPTLTVKVFLLELRPVMEELSRAIMWHQLIGNLVKLLRVLNFNAYY